MQNNNPIMETDKVILKCGNASFLCSKAALISRCNYFEAIYTGHFADSSKTEHEFCPDVMDAIGLQYVVKYVNTGDADLVEDLQLLVKIGKATAMLQAVEYEAKVWAKAATLISPEHCLSQAKLLNFQSNGALELLNICFKRVLWKFVELITTADFYALTSSEFYWLLRNPNLVDPLGGILTMHAIEEYCKYHFDTKESSSEYSSDDGDTKAKDSEVFGVQNAASAGDRYRARFLFAMVEGLEAKVSRDAPRGYTAQTLHEYSDQLRRSGGEQASDAMECDAQGEARAAQDDQDEDKPWQILLHVRAEEEFSPRRLTTNDLETILSWHRDNNVFKYLYDTQHAEAFKPCVVALKEAGSGKPGTYVPAIYSFDRKSCQLEYIDDLPHVYQGSTVTAYGSQCIMIGGEQTIGNNKFLRDIYVYDEQSSYWENLNIQFDNRRNFLHAWLPGSGCAVLGGFGNYRIHARSVQLLYNNNAAGGQLQDTCWAKHPSRGRAGSWTAQSKELCQLPPAVSPRLAALTATDHHLVLFCQANNMHIYCCYASEWVTRDTDMVGVPEKGFKDAFMYGTGVYLTAWLSRSVYWVLLDVDFIKGLSHIPEQPLPPAFTAVHYGEFSCPPLSVCRLHDKLYSFSHDPLTNERVVEVMTLRFNPFDPVNVLRVPQKCTSVASSVSAASGSDANIAHPPVAAPSPTEAPAPQSRYTPPKCISPSRQLMEHCVALDHKGPTANQVSMMHTYVEDAISENVGGNFLENTIRKSALNLARSRYCSWLADPEQNSRAALDISQPHLDNGCWWCRHIMYEGHYRPYDGPHPSVVSSQVLWRGKGKDNVRFKKDNDDLASGIGCFPLYDPFPRVESENT